MINLLVASLFLPLSHFLISSTPLRATLVNLFGERRYSLGYSLLAVAAVVWPALGSGWSRAAVIVPRLERISVLLDMSNASEPPQWMVAQTASQSLGLPSQLFDIRKHDDLQPAFDMASRQRGNALVFSIDTVIQANSQFIVDLAAQHRLPAIYASKEFADVGGLMTFGVNYPDLYRRAAIYVDKILKGAMPAELPIEQPTKFELVINLKAAKALGLEIPPTLIGRADEVID